MANEKTSLSEILAWVALALGILAVVGFGLWTELAPPPSPELSAESAANLNRVVGLLGGSGITAGQLSDDPARLERAGDLLRQELAKNPESAEVHRLLGLHAMAAGEAPRALESLERSEALAPRRLDTLLATAAAHAELEDLEAAEKVLRTAAEIYPRAPAVLHNLGQIVWLRGREAEAVEIYERKIELVRARTTVGPEGTASTP
ncbi:MAG: tetratricopeptide repeat protein [Acidobacteriota bacterium]